MEQEAAEDLKEQEKAAAEARVQELEAMAESLRKINSKSFSFKVLIKNDFFRQVFR